MPPGAKDAVEYQFCRGLLLTFWNVFLSSARLHGLGFHDGMEKALDFGSFGIRHDFGHARFGTVVIE